MKACNLYLKDELLDPKWRSSHESVCVTGILGLERLEFKLVFKGLFIFFSGGKHISNHNVNSRNNICNKFPKNNYRWMMKGV